MLSLSPRGRLVDYTGQIKATMVRGPLAITEYLCFCEASTTAWSNCTHFLVHMPIENTIIL